MRAFLAATKKNSAKQESWHAATYPQLSCISEAVIGCVRKRSLVLRLAAAPAGM